MHKIFYIPNSKDKPTLDCIKEILVYIKSILGYIIP